MRATDAFEQLPLIEHGCSLFGSSRRDGLEARQGLFPAAQKELSGEKEAPRVIPVVFTSHLTVGASDLQWLNSGFLIFASKLRQIFLE